MPELSQDVRTYNALKSLQTPQLSEAGQPTLNALVERLGSRDWRVVAQAEQALGAAGEAGMQAVIRGMTHPRPLVRRRCAGFMDHHGDDRCVLGLADRLLSDPVAYVRREAVHALGCDRCKHTPLASDRIPLLINALRDDTSIKVRREAAWGLSQMTPDPRALSEMRRIIAHETDKPLRSAAHNALYHHDAEYRARHIAQTRQRQAI